MADTHLCEIKVDRIIATASFQSGKTPPYLEGYQVVRDSFVRYQTDIPTYSRARELWNARTRVRIYVRYERRCTFLAPFKITIIGDDQGGLSRRDILHVLKAFRNYHLLLIEIAFDFFPDSGVDADYVRQHGVFGKSRVKLSRLFANSLRYGGRRSGKMVRCYWKKSIDRFRVELELHSALLSQLDIRSIEEIKHLAASLCPVHFRFAQIDVARLRTYLSQRAILSREFTERALLEPNSTHGFLTVLRTMTGVANAHRFLIDLPINNNIIRELRKWADRF
jgi:hypothetical protein